MTDSAPFSIDAADQERRNFLYGNPGQPTQLFPGDILADDLLVLCEFGSTQRQRSIDRLSLYIVSSEISPTLDKGQAVVNLNCRVLDSTAPDRHPTGTLLKLIYTENEPLLGYRIPCQNLQDHAQRMSEAEIRLAAEKALVNLLLKVPDHRLPWTTCRDMISALWLVPSSVRNKPDVASREKALKSYISSITARAAAGSLRSRSGWVSLRSLQGAKTALSTAADAPPFVITIDLPRLVNGMELLFSAFSCFHVKR